MVEVNVVYGKEELNKLMKKAMEIPEKMKELEEKLFVLNKKKDYIDKRKQEIKDRLYFNIYNETDDEGKKKYTNEKMRELEVSNRLLTHEEYNQLSQEEKEVIDETQKAKIELATLRREANAIDRVVELMKIKYKMW